MRSRMDKTSMQTDIRHKLWELLHHTNSLLVKYADVKLLEETGISYQQFLVLLMMDRLGKAATGTQIADMLDRNPNTLSMIIDRMTEGGLVKRQRDMKDHRCVRIVMTPKGKSKLIKTVDSGWSIIGQLAEPFTEEELKTFASLTEKLLKQTYKVLVPEKVAKRAANSLSGS
jgi:DNA-binding MarR family transcriptional regulator